MANDSVIIRFSEVSYEYEGSKKLLLEEASFSVRLGSRVTLMGQNGAGKSTLFSLITGERKPTEGQIHITPKDASIAIARQVMPKEFLGLSVRDYFASAFTEKKYNLDKLIKDVFNVVNITLPPEEYLHKQVKTFSGGQQARLLLAHALIQNPDILLLDEPTNNLDQAGIEHLTGFLMMYEKTVLVISHDADFLNAFSDGVLYLDVFTKKVEQYYGNYLDTVEAIRARIERENLQNVRAQVQIKEKRSQAEVFAHKGGKLRAVAKRMREAAEEAEENVVSVRQEDKTIREFNIPVQEYEPFFDGKVLEFSEVSVLRKNKMVRHGVEVLVRKNNHLLISGPNGIGKTTLLEKLASGAGEGFKIAPEIRIGYYKQDFSNFTLQQKAFDALAEVMQKGERSESGFPGSHSSPSGRAPTATQEQEHILRSVAAGFLLDGKLLDQQIQALSEGQKGLLSFCRLVLMKPGLLILDEPTNHINFRHLPVIAKALGDFEGALVMVSHIPEFVSKVRIDETLDLQSL